jgi:mannose-1-phosphate guanylyltransferase
LLKVPRDTATRYGCIVADPQTAEVLHYTEKPQTFVSDLISCGVYLFSPMIFKDMEKAVAIHHQHFSSADVEEYHPDSLNPDSVRLEQDILRPLAGTKRLFVYETKEFWRQIKNAASAVPANKLYLSHYRQVAPGRLSVAATGKEASTRAEIIGDVFIHPTASVHPSCKLGPNVSIGPRAVIGKGVRIKESIILDNVEVKVRRAPFLVQIWW